MGPHGVVIRSSSAYMAFRKRYDTGVSIPQAAWATQQSHYDLSYLDFHLVYMIIAKKNSVFGPARIRLKAQSSSDR
jgi:hypothetical protein